MSVGSATRRRTRLWWRRQLPIALASAVFATLLVLALIRLLLPSL